MSNPKKMWSILEAISKPHLTKSQSQDLWKEWEALLPSQMDPHGFNEKGQSALFVLLDLGMTSSSPGYAVADSMVTSLLNQGANPLSEDQPMLLPWLTLHENIQEKMVHAHQVGKPFYAKDGSNLLHVMANQAPGFFVKLLLANKSGYYDQAIQQWLQEKNNAGQTPLGVLWQEVDLKSNAPNSLWSVPVSVVSPLQRAALLSTEKASTKYGVDLEDTALHGVNIFEAIDDYLKKQQINRKTDIDPYYESLMNYFDRIMARKEIQSETPAAKAIKKTYRL